MRAAEQPKSLLVKSQGQEYRRDRRHLLEVPQQNRELIEGSLDHGIDKNPVKTEESSSAEGVVTEKFSNAVVSRSGRISKANPRYKDYHA